MACARQTSKIPHLPWRAARTAIVRVRFERLSRGKSSSVPVQPTAETKARLTLPDAAHRLAVLSGEDDNVREPINSCSTDF
jgi:hypothetical protein